MAQIINGSSSVCTFQCVTGVAPLFCRKFWHITYSMLAFLCLPIIFKNSFWSNFCCSVVAYRVIKFVDSNIILDMQGLSMSLLNSFCPWVVHFQEMETTYSVTVDDVECAFFDQVDRLRDFGSYNKETISQLVWAFFNYWAYRHDFANSVISVRTGSIIRLDIRYGSFSRIVTYKNMQIYLSDIKKLSMNFTKIVCFMENIRLVHSPFSQKLLQVEGVVFAYATLFIFFKYILLLALVANAIDIGN